MIKVLIADDQELIRQSLSIILGLKEEISVVGGVGDGTEVLEFIAKEKPGVTLERPVFFSIIFSINVLPMTAS